ncbi:MAG: hypothetical protein NVS2B16_31770 [Chloroflexota bacterium]
MPRVSQSLSSVELVSRVLRLTGIGESKIRARFEASDSCVQHLPEALTELDVHRVSLRLHRDWLYCSLRAWEPFLASWEEAGSYWTEASLPLLARSYKFLAQRFIPVQEWSSGSGARGGDVPERTRMVW